MAIHARYYDGIKAEPKDAWLNLGASALLIQIQVPESELEWEYANVRIIEKPEHGRPLIISSRTENSARIIVNDNSLYDSLIKKIPKENTPLITVSTSSKSLALWSIPALAIIVGIYWLVPQLAAPIAMNFPRSWEKKLGEYAVAALTRDKPVCKNADGVKALDKLVRILTTSLENQPQMTAEVIQEKQVNAFAAPGGRIVIFSKLIDSAENPDELAGVIAHEMGHVIKRHPTQTLVRAVGLDLVITMVFGGAGNTSTTASLANEIFQMKYNRNFEREADQVATEILYNSGIDNRGFVNFFVRLQSDGKGVRAKIFSYISSHPDTSERIQSVQKAKSRRNAEPSLTNKEWQALKDICRTASTPSANL